MIAFHGDSNIKTKYVERIKAHALADEIVHGQYWQHGKGCAVGCTIHGANHARYEKELGVPRVLARLEDRIFEGMGNGDSKEFPLRFLLAIEPGADLSLVWNQFAHWLLVDEKDGVFQRAKTKKTKDAIQLVANLHGRAARGLLVERSEWVSAREVAAAAYADADAAAAYAADAAAAAAAYAAAAFDAAFADAAAADAVTAAAYAAAAFDAAFADAAADAWTSARSRAFKRQADKLIELLAAKVA